MLFTKHESSLASGKCPYPLFGSKSFQHPLAFSVHHSLHNIHTNYCVPAFLIVVLAYACHSIIRAVGLELTCICIRIKVTIHEANARPSTPTTVCNSLCHRLRLRKFLSLVTILLARHVVNTYNALTPVRAISALHHQRISSPD